MIIKHISKDIFGYFQFEDIFTESELDLIWKELNFLCVPTKLKEPEETGSAKKSGIILKKNRGLCIDQCYTDKSISNYLNLYKKPFCVIAENEEEICNKDPVFRSFFTTNFESTLLSYYEDGDYYQSHIDACVYTYVFYIFKEPKHFEGGSLILDDLQTEIEIKSNMGILFPSWLNHTVTDVKMKSPLYMNKNLGRFCLSTFFSYNHTK